MTDRPPNIPTVEEAKALVAAAELLNAAFPHRGFGHAVPLAQIRLRSALDFAERGPLPVTVGSKICYTDSQGVWRTGRVAKVGRKWVTLNNGSRFDITTGIGSNDYGARERVSDTDAWRLAQLARKRTVTT